MFRRVLLIFETAITEIILSVNLMTMSNVLFVALNYNANSFFDTLSVRLSYVTVCMLCVIKANPSNPALSSCLNICFSSLYASINNKQAV